MEEERDIHPAQLEAYRRMSPAEKLNMAMEMRNAAWELKRAYLSSLHPEWTAAQVEEAVREIFSHAGD